MTSATEPAWRRDQEFQEATSAQVRDELGELIRRDLLGPWNGDDEFLQGDRGPRDRYLIGALGPRQTADDVRSPIEAAGQMTDTELDGGSDEPGLPQVLSPQALGSMWASSMGVSFAVPADVDRLSVDVSWGSYDRSSEETLDGVRKGGWKRIPHHEPVEIALDGSEPEYRLGHDGSGVKLDVTVRELGARRVVRVTLINCQDAKATPKEKAWMFQTWFQVRAMDGDRAVFLPIGDPQDPDVKAAYDDEENHLDLLYRDALRHCFGHNVATRVARRPGERNAHRIETSWLPSHEVPQVAAAPLEALETSMDRLAVLAEQPDPAALVEAVTPLVTEYRGWLAEQHRGVSALTRPHLRHAAESALDRAGRIADRIDTGIRLLATDAQARQAFGFANRVMALQRRNTQAAEIRGKSGGGYREAFSAIEARGAEAASWRPFQLGFVLLNLPSLTDPAHAERSELVDLLFFPTGGGKTEAYLGLAAYTFAMRRLQGVVGKGDDARDGGDGVAVLMRYTLRMLTAQQFQRAAALVCAAEKLRRDDPATWGVEPFRIGLWVGRSVSPNWFNDDAENIAEARQSGRGEKVLQITACPWCGAELKASRDLRTDDKRRRVFLYCPDGEGRDACPFSERMSRHAGLPILSVDEYLYRMPPTLLIATVDKFAQLTWRGEAGILFGRVTQRCDRHGYWHPDMAERIGCQSGHRADGDLPKVQHREVTRLRPPDLVIQDELHLISDALGTTVGLYENVVDELTSWRVDGRRAGPKIIASTATTKRAAEQVRQLYARDLAVFPPQLKDSTDTFFSREVPVSTEEPGRRYLGLCAHGTRLKAVEIRLAEILLIAGQTVFDKYGAPADPYMTLVGYFNATRELAGMRRYLDDDVAIRVRMNGRRRGLSNRLGRRGLLTVEELTSRINSGDITSVLKQVAESFDPERHTSARRVQIGEELTLAKKEGREPRLPESPDKPRVDVVLATSMLQVGVDVSRFGLMVVTGQPKNTAEYIQATSRVGRDKNRPGLVVTVYNWSRPRDLAHFEDFTHYHETFYRRVEALTVTPYARRAIDRTGPATFIGTVRQVAAPYSENTAAQDVDLDGPVVSGVMTRMLDRAERAAGATGRTYLSEKLETVRDHWADDRSPTIRQGYRTGNPRSGPVRGMLQSPEDGPWGALTVGQSMRETENEINLLVSATAMAISDSGQPPWTFGAPSTDDGDDTGVYDDDLGTPPARKRVKR